MVGVLVATDVVVALVVVVAVATVAEVGGHCGGGSHAHTVLQRLFLTFCQSSIFIFIFKFHIGHDTFTFRGNNYKKLIILEHSGFHH